MLLLRLDFLKGVHIFMKKILIGLAILIGIFFLLGLVAPKDFVIEREVVINKPKEQVFNYLRLMKNNQNWSPWSKMDPQMIIEEKGEDGTIGYIYSWSGNKQVGIGEQEIKNIVEGERIDLELRFKEPMEDTSAAYFITEAVDENQTKVKWGMVGKWNFPGNVICMILDMKSKLGEQFQDGLNSLKVVLER